jgi:hypothetical protein
MSKSKIKPSLKKFEILTSGQKLHLNLETHHSKKVNVVTNKKKCLFCQLLVQKRLRIA